jgi:hypothetical protein
MGHTITSDILLQLTDLLQRRVLPTRPEQITKRIGLHALVATLVEQRECFLVVCRGLRVVRCVRCHPSGNPLNKQNPRKRSEPRQENEVEEMRCAVEWSW